MSVELLPCPFCGGRAKLYERKNERPSERWYVECMGFSKCGVFPHTYPSTKLEAIEAWNTRYCSECHERGLEDDYKYCPHCDAKVVE